MSRALTILQNCRRAIPSAGRLLLIEPLLDPAVPLNGARCFEEATQREAAHDRDSGENHDDQHIVAY
jgi:hypothetical protein